MTKSLIDLQSEFNFEFSESKEEVPGVNVIRIRSNKTLSVDQILTINSIYSNKTLICYYIDSMHSEPYHIQWIDYV